MDIIINEKTGIPVRCLYYGTRQENMVCRSKILKYGDIITISNQGKYVLGIGWFIFISVNGQVKDFVRAADLEKALETDKALPVVDVVLDYFELSLQIDMALEHRNKELFLSLSNKQKETSYLFDKITGKLLPGSQPSLTKG